jgi:hypothetical protein
MDASSLRASLPVAYDTIIVLAGYGYEQTAGLISNWTTFPTFHEPQWAKGGSTDVFNRSVMDNR